MTFRRRVAASALLLGVGACALSVSGEPRGGVSWVPSAHAQGPIRNLIARLRGQTLPEGIVKSNGRLEATQVDVSSKYAGRLAEVTVEEGSSVTQGQADRETHLAGIRGAVARRQGRRAEGERRACVSGGRNHLPAERARIRQIRL